jgi:hypothetical protein
MQISEPISGKSLVRIYSTVIQPLRNLKRGSESAAKLTCKREWILPEQDGLVIKIVITFAPLLI